MRTKIFKFVLGGVCLAWLLCAAAAGISAQDKSDKKDEMSDAKEEASEAASVLKEMMKKPDDFIPRELLDKAEAIAVFPDVLKAGFIFGGRGGDGVVARRTATGWSTPVFYNISGASVGAQIGIKRTDFVMLFMNDGSLRDLLDEKVELGAGVSLAAGPVGRTAGVGTNATLDAGILTWSMSEGAFVGASLKGAVLTADNSMNKAVYGMEAKDILAMPQKVKTAALPSQLRSFTNTVEKYAAK